MAMIKLDYGVLAMLSQNELSGYDITSRLNKYWKTSHSRIYPVLAKLEKLGFAHFQTVEQTNKPDKKVYHITDAGIETLKNWLMSTTLPAIKKDEALMKLMCIHLLGKDVVVRLLKERISLMKKELKEGLDIINEVKQQSNGKVTSTNSQYFNAHVLSEIMFCHVNLDILWCKWVLNLYEMEGAENFLDMKLTDYIRDHQNELK